MRAAVCRAFGAPLKIEELGLDPPSDGELLVRLGACAICHSDIAYAEGAWGGMLPAVYGHEAAGTVVATGADARGFAVGDRVLVTLIRSCGACPACAREAPTSCHHAWDARPSRLRDAAGAPVAQAMNTGAFAEMVLVDASQCVRLPGDIGFDVAALLACGVITGVGAVINTARVPPGAAVAVIGAGGVGLNAIQGAALRGAAPIIAIDVAQEKLAAARAFGASHGVAAGPGAAEAVRELTDGQGVDFAFVTVGAPAAITEAPALLAPGGAAVIVGMTPSGTMVPYDACSLAAMNHRLLGSRMGETVLARDVPWLIDAWRAGRLQLEPLISARYPLERINEAIAAARSGRARRVVIEFGS